MKEAWLVALALPLLGVGVASAGVIETAADPADVTIIGQPESAGHRHATVGGYVAVGDLNADGLLDIATTGSHRSTFPTVSILFGRSPWPATWDFRTTPPDVVLHEASLPWPMTSCFGSPLGSMPDDTFTNIACGDLTGDGIDDLVVGGACWDATDGYDGIVLIVPGRSSWPASLDIDPRTWSPAFVGPLDDGRFGGSVHVADFNDDGVLDLLAGAIDAPALMTGSISAGRLYAVRGPIPDLRQDIDAVASILDGTDPGAGLGRIIGSGHLSPAIPHGIVLGQDYWYPSGRVMLVDGSMLEPAASVASTSALVRELYGARGDAFGSAVDLGDVDCSGWGDLLVFSSDAGRPDGSTHDAGRVDLFRDVARTPGGGTPSPDLTIWGRIEHFSRGALSGRMITAACLGDLNDDGFDDVIIGQPWSDSSAGGLWDQGDATIIWNRPDLPATIDLEDDSEWRLRLVGSGVGLGYGATTFASDIDGDGRTDLLVGTATHQAVGTASLWPDGGLDIFLRNLHVTTITPEAGPDQIADIVTGSMDCSTTVSLYASASIDRDGHPMRHRWYEGVTLLAEGEVVTVSLPAGEHCIRLLSTSDGGWAQDKLHVTVHDLAPPEIRSITVDPTELWPPNHRMRPVHVNIDAWDACTPASELSVRLVRVRSNEPADERGDGHSDPDVAGWEIGTSDLDGELRAERSGRRGGREYTLTYEVRDASGNTAVASTTVAVMHDRSGLRGTGRSTRRR